MSDGARTFLADAPGGAVVSDRTERATGYLDTLEGENVSLLRIPHAMVDQYESSAMVITPWTLVYIIWNYANAI